MSIRLKPLLVLLPGLDGTGRLFADFVASFGQVLAPVVISYPTDIELGYEALESLVRSRLPQDKPFFLLAESFSGPIGISIAASPPPGLQGLILCCSFARNPLPVPALLHPFVDILPVSAVPVRLLGFFLLGRFSSPSRLAALDDALARVSPKVLRARGRAAMAIDVSTSLSQLRMPVLYLRASEDRVVPLSSSRRVVSLAPQTRVVEYVAPHFLLQVLPSQAASQITEFMGISPQ